MGTILAFPAQPVRLETTPAMQPGGLLHRLFGSVTSAPPPPDPKIDLALDRARLVQAHLRTVHDMVEHLGPAEAVEICRSGLEAAQAALTKECGP